MKERGYVEGTTGITYVHKKDERRHRSRCIHYHKDGSCAYMSRCGGAAHCQLYKENEIENVICQDNYSVTKSISQYSVVDEKEKNNKAEVFVGIKAIKLCEIVVPDKFLRYTPDKNKVRELYDYYQEHKKLDKPVYVSVKGGKYHLEDKYLRYYVAKQLGKTWINARIGTCSESKLFDRLRKKGNLVQHKKYGTGTVIDTNGNKFTILILNLSNSIGLKPKREIMHLH